MTYETPRFLSAPPSVTQQVLDYVKAHPECRRRDIVRALGLTKGSVSTILSRLSLAGKVHRASGDAIAAWVEGPPEGWVPPVVKADGSPSQETVTTWTPDLRRDYLTAALFGMENVDRRQS